MNNDRRQINSEHDAVIRRENPLDRGMLCRYDLSASRSDCCNLATLSQEMDACGDMRSANCCHLCIWMGGSGKMSKQPVKTRLATPVLFAFACCILAVCTSCSKRLTEESLTQIRVGMTRPEVEAILGQGKSMDTNNVHYLSGGMPYQMTFSYTPDIVRWKEGKTIIGVVFRNGKVEEVGSSKQALIIQLWEP